MKDIFVLYTFGGDYKRAAREAHKYLRSLRPVEVIKSEPPSDGKITLAEARDELKRKMITETQPDAINIIDGAPGLGKTKLSLDFVKEGFSFIEAKKANQMELPLLDDEEPWQTLWLCQTHAGGDEILTEILPNET